MQYRSLVVLALFSLIAFGACGSEEEGPAPSEQQAEILSFTADPASIEPGQDTTLAWRTRNATSISIVDGSGEALDLEGAAPEQGSISISPTASATYTLLAQGRSSRAEQELRVLVANTPTIEYFRPNRDTIPAGEETRLLWEVADAERIVIRAGDEIVHEEEGASVGSLLVAPEASTTYLLEAQNADVQATASTTVEVQPVIDSFVYLGETPLAEGEQALLGWEVRGAEALFLSNGEVEAQMTEAEIAAGEGEIEAAPGGRFTLIARSGELESTAELRADVRPLPRILSFELPERVTKPDESAALVTAAWEVENADEVLLLLGDEEPLQLSASGEMELSLQETTEFTLRAQSAVGAAEERRSVSVLAPARILSFTADREAIVPGETVTLDWEVENFASLELSRNGETMEIPEAAETLEDQPTETSTYTLTATDQAGGSLSRGLVVVVADVLVVAELSAQPTALPEGDPLTLSWTVSTAVEDASLELSLRDDAGAVYDVEGQDPRQGAVTIPAPAYESGSVTFILEAQALGATALAEITVLVAPAPSILLSSDPPALNPAALEEEVELHWSTEGAASLELFRLGSNNTRIPLDPVEAADLEQGSMMVEIPGPSRFEAEAIGPDGVKRIETYHLGFGEPTIHDFSASSTEVSAGSTVTFEWDTSYGVVEFEGVRDEQREEQSLPLIDLASLGETELTLSGCYGECGSISFPSGFSFPYFGSQKSMVAVNLHGFVGFEEMQFDDQYFDGTCIDEFFFYSAPDLVIAPYWSDFELVEPGSGIFWAQGLDLMGRRFVVIEWRAVSHWWDGTGTFQLLLWEDGTFDYRYGAMVEDSLNGEDGAIGHFDDDAADAYQLLCEEGIVGGLSERAWRHYGPPPSDGSAQFVVDQTGDYELCVLGFNNQRACETITINVSP